MNDNDRLISMVLAFLIGYYAMRTLLRAVETFGDNRYLDGVNDAQSIFREAQKAYKQRANRDDGAAEAT